jgi:alkaline phosphatase
MSQYIDGFVIPIPKNKIKLYQSIAKKAGKLWMKYGALEYRECVGDDLKVKDMTPFTKIAGTKTGETVVFSWITYKSKAHRDKVNAKVMKDPAIHKMMQSPMPFDCKRMAYGGFKTLVKY